ncbi:MAG: AAA family ATPase [Oscillospiraceae bacterium]|nr:AAA family ATPase [Oscillospiraceae bacterium]
MMDPAWMSPRTGSAVQAGPQDTLLDILGSPEAMAVYLVVLMLLTAALTAYVLIALHQIRKSGEAAAQAQETRPQEKGTSQDEAAPRFVGLSQIDMELKEQRPAEYDSMSLAQLCDGFHQYAAGKLGLYYDITDIRRFVAGMGISKLMILRGISGTGKTSLAYAAGEYFGNPSTIVPVQPMWKERSDIVGYFNSFTKRFNETPLLRKLYEAGGKQDVYITVLDEVNISRIEYYFADFLSLLELPDPKRRELDLVSDSWDSDPQRIRGGKLLLPENMWFIGTANNDDSTFSISDKVYDRAAVMDLDRRSQPFPAKDTPAAHISFQELDRRFEMAKRDHSLSERSRTALAQLDQHLTEVYRISFGNRIMGQIERYVPIMCACGGTELEALDDILARKILRKLEQLSPSVIKRQIPGSLSLLDELFGAELLPQSRGYLDRLIKSV